MERRLWGLIPVDPMPAPHFHRGLQVRLRCLISGLARPPGTHCNSSTAMHAGPSNTCLRISLYISFGRSAGNRNSVPPCSVSTGSDLVFSPRNRGPAGRRTPLIRRVTARTHPADGGSPRIGFDSQAHPCFWPKNEGIGFVSHPLPRANTGVAWQPASVVAIGFVLHRPAPVKHPTSRQNDADSNDAKPKHRSPRPDRP